MLWQFSKNKCIDNQFLDSLISLALLLSIHSISLLTLLYYAILYIILYSR